MQTKKDFILGQEINGNNYISLPFDSRNRHLHIIGKTGMGKSTLLYNLVKQDIKQGAGLIMIDNYGDLAKKVRENIVEENKKRFVYLAPFEKNGQMLNWSLFTNLELNLDQKSEILTDILLSTSEEIIADPTLLKDCLYHSVKSLLLIENSPKVLMSLREFFASERYWMHVIQQIKDPILLTWWLKTWPKISAETKDQAKKIVVNLANSLGEIQLDEKIWDYSEERTSIAEIIENNNILCTNLAKGYLGVTMSKFFGALILEEVKFAIANRKNKNIFSIYLDEVQDFAQSKAFLDVLSDGHGNDINLVIAHQYIKQLSEIAYRSICANCASRVIFQCNSMDADSLANETLPGYSAQDITSLQIGEAIVRLWEEDVWLEAEKVKILASD